MREYRAETNRIRSDELLSLLLRQSSFLCIASGVWYWWMGFIAPLVVVGVTLAVYGFCEYELRRNRYPFLVRWLFFGATTACLLANSLNLGEESLVWLFFFPLLSGVGVFFMERSSPHATGIQAMIGLAVAVVAAIHFFSDFTAFEVGVDPSFQRAFSVFSIVGSTLTLLTLVHMNRMQEQKFHRRLEGQTELLYQAEKLSALGIMSGGVAHEINNPLATISLQLDILEAQSAAGRIRDTDGEIKASVERLRRMCARIGTIVTSLRNYARNGSTAPREKVRLAEVVEQTLSLLNSELKYKPMKIQMDFPKSSALVCERGGLMHILMNLVSNAADAIEPLEEKWIRIEGRETPEGYEVAVTDSGRGIPADQLEKIFLPFYTTKPVGRGTGLGLSLSQTIATSMGGQLTYDETAKNTRFVYLQPKMNSLENTLERKTA